MQNNKTKVALIYDFDETLSTQYMQDFCLIPQFGMTPDEFWAKANQWSRENGADQVTGSMYYFMKTAKEMGIRLTKENLKECGKGVIYFPGVLEWFERINRFGASLDLEIEHYIISSGYEEIMAGTEVSKYFKDIFACSYAFGADGTPVWPARVINYSIKTQYLSKINKGLGKNDDVAVNEFTPDEERPIPFKRMIYFGDGMTDIPSMKLTKERGGNAKAQPANKKLCGCGLTTVSTLPCTPIIGKITNWIRWLKPFWTGSPRKETSTFSRLAKKRKNSC